MKKALSILLTLAMILALGSITVFAEPSGGNISGVLSVDGTGNIVGTLTGDFTITVNCHATGVAGQITSFTGTISGDISGTVTGKINSNGNDSLFAEITTSSLPNIVYLMGGFPPVGIDKFFTGKIVSTTTAIAGTSAANITVETTDGQTTGFTAAVGSTLKFFLKTPAGYEVRWGVWSDDRHAGYATIDPDGTLHLLSMPTDGNVLIMANTMDPNVSTQNFTVTVTAAQSVVTANADVSYVVVIPASVDFGTIYKSMGTQTKPFAVAVESALVEANSTIKVTKTGSTIMKDLNGSGTNELAFTLAQPDGLFSFAAADLADGTQTITSSVSCQPSQLTAAGSYKGYMTFTVDYHGIA